MHFNSPAPTAPQWLAFLGSYVVPKDYMEKIGVDAFREKPVGSGPYRIAEYQLNSRIVLERNDAYWGPKPKMRRVTFEIIKDAVGARRRHPIRARSISRSPCRCARCERLKSEPNLAGELNPITRIILLQVRNDLGFADQNVRLAAHHAIDKKALSQAFYGGAAVPLSVPATPGTAAYLDDYQFAYDPELAKQLLAKSGYSTEKPAKFKFASTNGNFPSDYDIARALVQMWKKVGIEVELEVIEYAKYFELNRGNKLPEATLYSFDNATGDPEIFGGYLLNPEAALLALEGHGDRPARDRSVQRRELRRARRGLQGAEQGCGRERRLHAAPAERADASCARRTSPTRNTAMAGCAPTRWLGGEGPGPFTFALTSPRRRGMQTCAGSVQHPVAAFASG